MTLYFITGNENKLREVRSILGDVQQLDIDLTEIQDIDSEKIIRHKLQEALKHQEGSFIVEDTSLHISSLGGLPGPLIKWFMKTIGNEGIVDIVSNKASQEAEAVTRIGYAKNKDELYFFEGSIKGKIVQPVGENGFGWDQIFVPEGFDRTFAQMNQEEKNSLSMRKIAVTKLKEFIDSN